MQKIVQYGDYTVKVSESEIQIHQKGRCVSIEPVRISKNQLSNAIALSAIVAQAVEYYESATSAYSFLASIEGPNPDSNEVH